MDVAARVTSKGQVTIPKAVREALGITPGDRIVFRVAEATATVARSPDLLELQGSIDVPEEWRGAPWELIRDTAWERETRSRA